MAKKSILLKISGEVIKPCPDGFDTDLLLSIAKQIKQLDNYNFSIVIGGGNIYRANSLGKLKPQWGHYIGMLSTLTNGLIIQEKFESQAIKSIIFSAISCENIAAAVSPQNIARAKEQNLTMIFVGGIGAPYLTTDSTAVIRSLQVSAHELWKGTKVDGIYTRDPKIYSDAAKLENLTYDYAISNNLKILDMSAYAIAKENNINTRVFNIFEENALIKAAHGNYGSTITN